MSIGYIDTNILIDYFAGHEPAKATFEKFTALKLPAVSYIEFMAGIRTKQQRLVADKVINAIFEIVHTNTDICKEAARLRQELKLKLPDIMIYATARTGGGVLVTRNTKDFNADWADIDVPYG